MTIKRRLFISNILMIVIPIIIAIVIALGCITVVWMTIFNGAGYNIKNQQQLYDARDGLMQVTIGILKDVDQAEQLKELTKIENTLNLNKMALVVYIGDKLQYSLGASSSSNNDKLIGAIQALGGEGSVSAGNEELYAEQIQAQGKTYSIYIYNTKIFTDYETINTTIVSAAVLIILAILIVIFLTNRFLTRFVFRKIQEPLDILADGVHQIRDGNLDYNIIYNEKDEFFGVCNDFNDMAARLKQSVMLVQKQEQNRKELLADISHDIRSPLTSIKAYAEGLLDGIAKTPEAQKSYMQMIKKKSEDIDHMVAKLFLFSKMELGDYPYYPETLNLENEITSIVNAAKEEYSGKGLEVKIEELAKDIEIYADPVQLRSVFANILENSLKYNSKEQSYVSIRSEKHDNEVHIYIQDNGPGVSEEALSKLFNVFYRSDPSRNNPNKGSGLGLAITAKAIERMGGSICAKNSSPSGLCMVIKLPIKSKG